MVFETGGMVSEMTGRVFGGGPMVWGIDGTRDTRGTEAGAEMTGLMSGAGVRINGVETWCDCEVPWEMEAS